MCCINVKYFIAFALLLLCSCKAALYERGRLDASEMVLRVEGLSVVGGSKYCWEKVRVLDVYKGSNYVQKGKVIQIAHQANGLLPEGEFTVYLVRYNSSNTTHWKLLSNDGSGVSHVDLK